VALRSVYVKPLVVLAAACALVTFSARAASAAKTVLSGGPVSSAVSASAVASGGWGPGVEAVLPANAAPTKQSAGVSSVSCPSPGNCSAVGAYKDSSGVEQVLLLTETNGSWSTGVEAVLPANLSPTTPGFPSDRSPARRRGTAAPSAPTARRRALATGTARPQGASKGCC
jgi:hypothetical protein